MAGKEGKLKRRRSIPRGCNNNGGSAAEDDDDTVRANPSIRLDFIENTKGATQSLTKCSSDPLTNRNTSNSYPNDGEAPENLKRVALFETSQVGAASAEDEESSKHCESLPSLQTQSFEELSSTSTTARSNLFTNTFVAETTSILAPATQFPIGDSSNNNDIQNVRNYGLTSAAPSTRQSSLFGAVMMNAKSSATAAPHPSTPARALPVFFASPGGFQLQDFVNGFGNSPFQLKSAAHTTPLSRTLDDGCNSSSSSRDVVTPRRDVEWHECRLRPEIAQLGLVDWSMKAGLEFQCQSGNAILWKESNDAIRKQTALRQFARGLFQTDRPTHATTAIAAAVDWQAGLLYWQHPATHPLPSDMVSGRTAKSAATTGSLKHDTKDERIGFSEKGSSSNSGSRLFASMPPPKKPVRAFTANLAETQPSEDDTLLTTRAREWQEAFRSLYMTWIERIRYLNTQWKVPGEDFSHEITETYFYACGKGHTILFRVGVYKCELDGHNPANVLQRLVPEIIISSSTLTLRQKLRSMGVKLILLERWNGMTGEFSEESLFRSEQSMSEKDTAKQLVDASPNVKAELVALRRAQVFGQTVGADVSVSIRPKGGNNLLSRSPKRIPPLRITGLDDCAAFFGVYFNSLGLITTAVRSHELVYDVPVLLCRKLGPCLHFAIKSVRTLREKLPVVGDKVDAYSTIDLQGYLLPCAVRDLVCASVNFMLADEACERSTFSDKSDFNGDIGSHHLVVRTTVHSGEEMLATDAGTIGSHDSKWFNGPWDFLTSLHDQGEIQSCRYDEIVMLAVWDITRPQSLAYKLEHMSAILLE